MARSRRRTSAGKERGSDEGRIKAELALLIGKLVHEKGFNQTEAGTKLGMPRSDVSKIVRGKISGVSLERLLKIVRKLGRDVEIRVSPPAETREGRLSLFEQS